MNFAALEPPDSVPQKTKKHCVNLWHRFRGSKVARFMGTESSIIDEQIDQKDSDQDKNKLNT